MLPRLTWYVSFCWTGKKQLNQYCKFFHILCFLWHDVCVCVWVYLPVTWSSHNANFTVDTDTWHHTPPSASGKYIILRHTESNNTSITHRSELEPLDVAEIRQSRQTGEDTGCFRIAKDLFNEPYSQVIYSLISQTTVHFVNAPTHLDELSDEESRGVSRL